MPGPLRTFGGRLAALAAAALLLRLAYVLVFAREVTGSGDWDFFHLSANLLADGRFFPEPFLLTRREIEVPTAAHPPLYPLVLSVLSALGATSEQAHRLLGPVTGTGVVVVAGLIARRVAGPRAGLAAAALAAVYPVFVAADGALLSESLYGLLIALALLLALRLRGHPAGIAAPALGVCIGLAALTRSEALALLVLLGGPALWRVGTPRARATRAALVVLGCLVVVAPWTARNLATFERPVLISHNDSTVLAGANCPPAYGGPDLGGWRFDCISPRRTLDEGRQAARWRREGLAYAGENLGALPGVAAVRVLRTWDLWRPRRLLITSEGQPRWAAKAGLVGYFLSLPLAAFGLVALRRRGAPLLLLLGPVLLVTLSSVIAYGIPRFRHAAEIPLVVLAGCGLAALARRRSMASPAAEGGAGRPAAAAGEPASTP